MNPDILNSETQSFISDQLNTDITKLILKGSPFAHITIQELVEQIESKRKCKAKLPLWYNSENIYYPNKLNIEQTSSEITAKYKSQLISGNTIIDITGGFGIDAFYFSKRFKVVTHCEINTELSKIVNHNLKQLDISNVQTIAQDGIDYLISEPQVYDWIYIDPSRRHDGKGKVFMLKDCLPNVPLHLNTLFEYTNRILIKTSPLLDISIGLSELSKIKEIQVVAVNNEVKELLWILDKNNLSDVRITAVNIKKDTTEEFTFLKKDELTSKADLSPPLSYLYEPNAAILKSGAFDSIAQAFNVKKLHVHSHLYTSDNELNFPGRAFKIENIVPYSKREIKTLGLMQANITTRNFPERVPELRKKYKIKDGGSNYLFFTTNHLNDRIVIVCSKLY